MVITGEGSSFCCIGPNRNRNPARNRTQITITSRITIGTYALDRRYAMS